MDWNERYQNEDTPWDKGEATPVLDEILSRHSDVFTEKTILVPGCGTGHDARFLARTADSVTGIDIAPLAIELAKSIAPESSVHFVVGDILKAGTVPADHFDLAFEHTCFCALDPSLRKEYLEAIHRTLKPGGSIVGVFFINPEMDEGETGPPFGIPVSDLSKLLEEIGFAQIDSWTPTTGYPGRIGRELAMILEKRS